MLYWLLDTVNEHPQFVGYYLDVRAAGGRAAYRRGMLLQVLRLTEADVAEDPAE